LEEQKKVNKITKKLNKVKEVLDKLYWQLKFGGNCTKAKDVTSQTQQKLWEYQRKA